MSTSQQRLLRTILTGIPGILVLKGKHGQYEVANPHFCQFLAKGPDEIVGKKDGDLFPAEEAKVAEKEDSEALKTGMPRAIEQPFSGAEGTHWYYVTRIPVLDDEGDAAGILLFGRDITELRQRSEELEQRAATLAEGEARRNELEQVSAEAAKRLEETAAKSATLEEQLAEQVSRREALEAEQREREATLGEGEARRQELEQASAEVGRRLEEAMAKTATLEKQLAERASRADALEAGQREREQQAGELHAQLDAVRAQYEAVKAEEAQRAEALEKQEAARQQLAKQVEQLESEAAERGEKMEQALAEGKAKCNELERELELGRAAREAATKLAGQIVETLGRE